MPERFSPDPTRSPGGRPKPRGGSRALRRLRILGVAGASAALLLLPAAAASAHVRVTPDSTATGGTSELTFRVPDESDSAGTVKVKVTLPGDTPLTSVSTKPLPGWTASVQKGKLPSPVTVKGAQVTEAPLSVTWTADAGTAIGPGQYQTFQITAGPLPAAGSTLTLPAEQTYSDGTTVKWADAPKPDGSVPEHPAPSFVVTAAGTTTATPTGAAAGAAEGTTTEAGPGSDGTARWLGGGGLALGAAALIVAVLRRPGRTRPEALVRGQS